MLCTESYLDDWEENIGRKLKTLCRLNALPLMDKIGKREQWNTNIGSVRWKCPMCKLLNDNITHFFFECTAIHRYRITLTNKIKVTLTLAQQPNQHKLVRPKDSFFATPGRISCPRVEDPTITADGFLLLTNEEKLLILLGKQIGCPKFEFHIDTYVKRFLQKAWKVRRPHVEHTNKKYERNDYLITY